MSDTARIAIDMVLGGRTELLIAGSFAETLRVELVNLIAERDALHATMTSIVTTVGLSNPVPLDDVLAKVQQLATAIRERGV